MKRLAYLLILAVLCGCVRFQPRPLAPAETAARLDNRQLADPKLKQFLETNLGHELPTWPVAVWDFDSLKLAAFYFHPSLAVARAQWEVARAGVKTAGGRLNPVVNLTPGYDTSSMPNLSPWIPFLSIDIPLETAGKRSKRILEADELTEAAHWNIVAVAVQIRSAVRSALLEYVLARQRLEVLRQQMAAEEKAITLLRQRLTAGDIAQPEVALSEIVFNKAQLDFADAKSLHAQARAQLAQAIGLNDAALEGVKLVFDLNTVPAIALTSANVRRLALCGRADIRVGLASYAAAEAELRLQIAKQFPDVHFSPGYQFDQGDNKWSMGITFEVPVVNQNQGPIAEAEARRTESAARFTELQSKVIGQVDLAIAALKTRQESLAMFRNLTAAQSQRSQSAKQMFNAGAGEQLDVLSADVEYFNAALLELDAQGKFQQALGALEEAVQSPLDQKIEGIPETAFVAPRKSIP